VKDLAVNAFGFATRPQVTPQRDRGRRVGRTAAARELSDAAYSTSDRPGKPGTDGDREPPTPISVDRGQELERSARTRSAGAARRLPSMTRSVTGCGGQEGERFDPWATSESLAQMESNPSRSMARRSRPLGEEIGSGPLVGGRAAE